MFDYGWEFVVRVGRHVAVLVGLALDVLAVIALTFADASTLIIALPYLLLVLAVSVVVAAFLVFQEERRTNEPNPCLCDLVVAKEQHRWTREAPGGGDVGAYLCLVVQNTSNRDLVNCRLRLERVLEWLDQSQGWYVIDWFNALVLAVSLNDGGGATTTIVSGGNRTWDVVAYESERDTHLKVIAAQEALRASNRLTYGR